MMTSFINNIITFSPRSTLKCLRLSLLDPSILHNFEVYAAWRMDVIAYERLVPWQRQQRPFPRLPVQASCARNVLFDIAYHAAVLPNLRMLILELNGVEDSNRYTGYQLISNTIRQSCGRGRFIRLPLDGSSECGSRRIYLERIPA